MAMVDGIRTVRSHSSATTVSPMGKPLAPTGSREFPVRESVLRTRRLGALMRRCADERPVPSVATMEHGADWARPQVAFLAMSPVTSVMTASLNVPLLSPVPSGTCTAFELSHSDLA